MAWRFGGRSRRGARAQFIVSSLITTLIRFGSFRLSVCSFRGNLEISSHKRTQRSYRHHSTTETPEAAADEHTVPLGIAHFEDYCGPAFCPARPKLVMLPPVKRAGDCNCKCTRSGACFRVLARARPCTALRALLLDRRGRSSTSAYPSAQPLWNTRRLAPLTSRAAEPKRRATTVS